MLVRFIFTIFSSGKAGFATKAPAKKITNSFFSGRLSTFNKVKGASTSPSFSPIKDCEGYIFLDDEYQDAESIASFKDVFKDGAYLMVEVVDGELVDLGEEPMTIDDVTAGDLDVAPAYVASSVAS
tara:strand:+ start:125 stop:502 length:378 start_codon:yes stop_codon:yes gene_type:complete